jgi:hypothetical protein
LFLPKQNEEILKVILKKSKLLIVVLISVWGCAAYTAPLNARRIMDVVGSYRMHRDMPMPMTWITDNAHMRSGYVDYISPDMIRSQYQSPAHSPPTGVPMLIYCYDYYGRPLFTFLLIDLLTEKEVALTIFQRHSQIYDGSGYGHFPPQPEDVDNWSFGVTAEKDIQERLRDMLGHEEDGYLGGQALNVIERLLRSETIGNFRLLVTDGSELAAASAGTVGSTSDDDKCSLL